MVTQEPLSAEDSGNLSGVKQYDGGHFVINLIRQKQASEIDANRQKLI
jgi:hypothetical protein